MIMITTIMTMMMTMVIVLKMMMTAIMQMMRVENINNKLSNWHFSTLVNGGWSGWGSWGACSKTCGKGVRARTRSCTNPRPQFSGTQCAGSISQQQYCNTQECPPRECSEKLTRVYIICATVPT